MLFLIFGQYFGINLLFYLITYVHSGEQPTSKIFTISSVIFLVFPNIIISILLPPDSAFINYLSILKPLGHSAHTPQIARLQI